MYILFFWESIQVLRRGDRNVVYEMIFKNFVFSHSRFCFAPFQVLGSFVGGSQRLNGDSD